MTNTESDTKGVYMKDNGENISLCYKTHIKEVKYGSDGKLCAYAEDFADSWSMGLGPPVIVDGQDNEICRLPVKIPNYMYAGNATWIVPGLPITLWYGYNGSGKGDEFYVYDLCPTDRVDRPKRACISK